MRRLIGYSLIATISVASAAVAADMSTKAAPMSQHNWTGLYAGFNAGYGWGRNDAAFTSTDPLFGPAVAGGTIPNSLSPKPKGFVGGIQAGYNYQTGKFLIGVEADIAYSAMKGEASVLVPAAGADPTVITKQEHSVTWLSTLRGRLGGLVAADLLIYTTGGLAVGGVKATTGTVVPPLACAANAYCVNGSTSATRVGWALGAGTEYAIGPRWTLKAEYLYFDLGSASYAAPSTAAPFWGLQTKANFKGNIVRAGLNYRF